MCFSFIGRTGKSSHALSIHLFDEKKVFGCRGQLSETTLNLLILSEIKLRKIIEKTEI